MTTTFDKGTSYANGRLWGARARDWAEVQEGQFAAAYHAVLDHTGVAPGSRHLDAGCGAGMAAALSASLGASVSGLDASEALLEIARERTPSGDFRHGDLEALPFENDSFDLVTGFNAFPWTRSSRAARCCGIGCTSRTAGSSPPCARTTATSAGPSTGHGQRTT